MPIPKNLPKMRRTSAKQWVLSRLQQWIADGTLKPGEKIVDTELAEAMGVSRTPIREALQILETRGFVEMRPGKETKVTELTHEDVYRLYPPLAALEATAAEWAVDRMNPETITQLNEINEQFGLAVTQKNRDLAMELDDQFHKIIVDRADNPYISEFTAILQLHVRRLKYVYFQSGSMVPARASVEEHRAIIEALKDRDKEKAAAVMRRNWLRAMETVAKKIRKSPDA